MALVNASPRALQPYLLLSRIDKPIGAQLLFVPGALSIMAATPYGFMPDMVCKLYYKIYIRGGS